MISTPIDCVISHHEDFRAHSNEGINNFLSSLWLLVRAD